MSTLNGFLKSIGLPMPSVSNDFTLNPFSRVWRTDTGEYVVNGPLKDVIAGFSPVNMAIKQRLLQLHPDKNKSPTAGEDFDTFKTKVQMVTGAPSDEAVVKCAGLRVIDILNRDTWMIADGFVEIAIMSIKVTDALKEVRTLKLLGGVDWANHSIFRGVYTDLVAFMVQAIASKKWKVKCDITAFFQLITTFSEFTLRHEFYGSDFKKFLKIYNTRAEAFVVSLEYKDKYIAKNFCQRLERVLIDMDKNVNVASDAFGRDFMDSITGVFKVDFDSVSVLVPSTAEDVVCLALWEEDTGESYNPAIYRNGLIHWLDEDTLMEDGFTSEIEDFCREIRPIHVMGHLVLDKKRKFHLSNGADTFETDKACILTHGAVKCPSKKFKLI